MRIAINVVIGMILLTLFFLGVSAFVYRDKVEILQLITTNDQKVLREGRVHD